MGKRLEQTLYQRRYLDKYIERCSISLALKEIWTKERYYYAPIRMAKIKILTIKCTGEDVKQPDFSYITDGNEK